MEKDTQNLGNEEMDNQEQQQVNVISSELGQSKKNGNSTASSGKIIPNVTETVPGNLNDNEISISKYWLVDMVW